MSCFLDLRSSDRKWSCWSCKKTWRNWRNLLFVHGVLKKLQNNQNHFTVSLESSFSLAAAHTASISGSSECSEYGRKGTPFLYVCLTNLSERMTLIDPPCLGIFWAMVILVLSEWSLVRDSATEPRASPEKQPNRPWQTNSGASSRLPQLQHPESRCTAELVACHSLEDPAPKKR